MYFTNEFLKDDTEEVNGNFEEGCIFMTKDLHKDVLLPCGHTLLHSTCSPFCNIGVCPDCMTYFHKDINTDKKPVDIPGELSAENTNKFLGDVFPDPELRKYAQELFIKIMTGVKDEPRFIMYPYH